VKKFEIISALLGDVALPLAGFLFWDWGFYFISLFFLFDLFFRTLFLRRRLTPLNELKNRNRILFRGFIYSFIEILLIHCIVISVFVHLKISDSFLAFIAYEELGIPQGAVLLPLLLLNEFMKIRNENKIGVPYPVRAQIILKTQNLQQYRLLLWVLLYLWSLFFYMNETILITAFFAFFIVQPFLIFRNIK
jgi:hypothetical protein